MPLALLLDLDGTMVDTDPLHLAAFNQVLKAYDKEIDIEFYKRRIMGFPNDEVVNAILPHLGPEEWLALVAEKESDFRARVDRLDPTPGLRELLGWAREHDVRRAVVTNAPRENAIFMLQGLGLADAFDTIVIGDELEHAKPHPLPYLTALDRLGVAAEDAVAFEDSLSGMRAAAAAGVHTTGVLTSLDAASLVGAGADRVVEDFTDRDLLAWLSAAADGRGLGRVARR